MKNIILIIFFLTTYDLFSCTTAIISGKLTTDGRPLLLKHRDSDNIQNRLQFFDDGVYDYIGLVNSNDIEGNEVWGGVNSEGFAIINSASYNIKEKSDTTKILDREGFIMKKALQNCKTIKDFEKLLYDHEKPLGVEANFGVIDAYGGAAYYETNNFDFTKVDVNDAKTAPAGYVIRTNFSAKGRNDEGYGYIRYNTAEDLLKKASEENNLNYKFILQNVSRSLKHSLLRVDYSTEKRLPKNSEQLIPFQDYIPRHSSVSTVLIQGVKRNEAPELATLWTILGFQLTSVAIPTWVKAGNTIPEILVADSTGNAPLCNYALNLKTRCFPIQRGSGYRYIKLSELINKENKGIIQIIHPHEEEIFDKTKALKEVWVRKNSISIEETKRHYGWINESISKLYKKHFNL